MAAGCQTHDICNSQASGIRGRYFREKKQRLAAAKALIPLWQTCFYPPELSCWFISFNEMIQIIGRTSEPDINNFQAAFWGLRLSNLQISTKESPALKAADICFDAGLNCSFNGRPSEMFWHDSLLYLRWIGAQVSAVLFKAVFQLWGYCRSRSHSLKIPLAFWHAKVSKEWCNDAVFQSHIWKWLFIPICSLTFSTSLKHEWLSLFGSTLQQWRV